MAMLGFSRLAQQRQYALEGIGSTHTHDADTANPRWCSNCCYGVVLHGAIIPYPPESRLPPKIPHYQHALFPLPMPSHSSALVHLFSCPCLSLSVFAVTVRPLYCQK